MLCLLTVFGSLFPPMSMARQAPKHDHCFIHMPKLSTLCSSTPSPGVGLSRSYGCAITSSAPSAPSEHHGSVLGSFGLSSWHSKSFTYAREGASWDGAKLVHWVVLDISASAVWDPTLSCSPGRLSRGEDAAHSDTTSWLFS